MGSIQLKTSIPGPKASALIQRSSQAVPRGISQLTPMFVNKAEGAMIEDVDGNQLIDLAGGIGCLNVGHRNARVVAAVRKQLDRFLHTCFMLAPYESYVALAEKLNALAPGKTPKKTFFVNSGAEAVENAVKIARAYTKRPAIICFEDGFHGRTLLALGLTSRTNPYKAGFEPFPGEIYRVPYGHTELEDTFKRVVAAESLAAIIAEPVLGEGGFVPSPPGWWDTLKQVSQKYGIVLIADEIQSGFGRTGKLFAIEHYGVEPDIIVTAKSLGGGLPIAAVTGKSEIMDNTGPGSLGGTFGGNPMCCEAALAVIEEFGKSDLLDRSVRLGKMFTDRALSWHKRMPMVGDVRGLGAMQAIALVRQDGSPNPEATKQVTRYAYEHGVILVTAGTYSNVVRILMPLVITNEQMGEALDVLEAALETVAAAQKSSVESPVTVGVM
jgi:4-aminobutyrate aminotransferase / (S)-3-amino-2-methylpropionate transaminase / 5-aminovalerate transaminase